MIQKLAGKFRFWGFAWATRRWSGVRRKNYPRAKLFHGKTSQIRHDGSGVFRGLPNPFTATRYHSLIVERKSLPADLQVTAEPMTHHHGDAAQALPLMGVQFHPESVLTIQASSC